MNRNLIILLSMLCVNYTFAQLSIFNEYIQFNQKTKVYPVVCNGSYGMQLVFIGGKTINVYSLNNKGKTESLIEIKHNEKNIKDYYGSYLIREDSILMLNFGSKNMDELSQLSVNLSTKEYAFTSKKLNTQDYQYLASWEVPDSLFILALKRNSSTMVLTSCFDSKTVIKEYDATDLLLMSDLSLYEIFNSDNGKPVKISNDIPVSLYLSSAKNKLYKNGKIISLTLDNINNNTSIIDLNIESGNIVSSHHKIDDIDALNTKTNSFLAYGKLFQLQTNTDSISLVVTNRIDNTLWNRFVAYSGKKIHFANSIPVKQNEKQGFMYGHPEVKKLRSTKRFLKLASKMNPSITVNKHIENFQIKIGAVEEITQAGGVSANIMLSSGGIMEVGYGNYLLMPESVFNFPSNYSFISYLSRRSVYFSSLFNRKTKKHVHNKVSKFTYNFIEDYANLLPGNNSMVVIFKYAGDYYLGYYNNTTSSYNLKWFKNIDDHVIVF